jgi:hypothetical protein
LIAQIILIFQTVVNFILNIALERRQSYGPRYSPRAYSTWVYSPC